MRKIVETDKQQFEIPGDYITPDEITSMADKDPEVTVHEMEYGKYKVIPKGELVPIHDGARFGTVRSFITG